MILILFAAFAGAFQMLAPDHWMPISIFAWQRGWTVARSILFSVPFFILHVAAGFGLYLLLVKPLGLVDENHLALFTISFLGVIGLIRAFRFSRLGYVIHRAPRWNNRSLRGVRSLATFLGPSEMLIPVLMKAQMDQMDFGILIIAFFVGALLAGSLLVGVSRVMWNRPSVLPRAVEWCHGKLAAYPVALGALVASLLLTRILHG